MILAALLLFSSSLINVKPSPVFAIVYIGTAGPYRFLIDTGAEATLIDPKLAAKLHLQPEYRTELVTPQSTELVPGAKLTTLRLGHRVLPETEVLFHDVTEARALDPEVKGVLGLNALSSFDFTLIPPDGRIEDTSDSPLGETVSFVVTEGRIAIKARMGNETLTLVLDSGSSHLVFFHRPAAMATVQPVPSTITTIEGARSVVATCWSTDMLLSDHLRIGTLPAAIVEARGTEADGLLPASIFKQIHVDQARHELILVR